MIEYLQNFLSRISAVAFFVSLAIISGCVVARNDKTSNEDLSATNLLQTIDALSRLSTTQLLDSEIVIPLSKLPFKEDFELSGRPGAPRIFRFSVPDGPVLLGTYFYRNQVRANQSAAFISIDINHSKTCIAQTDVVKVFGDVWRAGISHNAFIPDPLLQLQKPGSPNFGNMGFVIQGARMLNFSFDGNKSDCVQRISIEEGKTK